MLSYLSNYDGVFGPLRVLHYITVRTLLAAGKRWSAGGDEVDVAQPFPVRNQFDLGDRAAGDGEAERAEDPAEGDDGQAGGAVNQGGADETGGPGVAERVGGDGAGAAHGRRAAGQPGAVVADQDVGVQVGDERLEIAVPQGGQEGVHDLALAGEVGGLRHGGALDPAAGAAG